MCCRHGFLLPSELGRDLRALLLLIAVSLPLAPARILHAIASLNPAPCHLAATRTPPDGAQMQRGEGKVSDGAGGRSKAGADAGGCRRGTVGGATAGGREAAGEEGVRAVQESGVVQWLQETASDGFEGASVIAECLLDVWLAVICRMYGYIYVYLYTHTHTHIQVRRLGRMLEAALRCDTGGAANLYISIHRY